MITFSGLNSWLNLKSKPTCCCWHTKTACHRVEILIRLKPSALVLFQLRSVTDRKAAAFLVSDDRSADLAKMTALLPVSCTIWHNLTTKKDPHESCMTISLLWPTNDWNLVCRWGSTLKKKKVLIQKDKSIWRLSWLFDTSNLTQTMEINYGWMDGSVNLDDTIQGVQERNYVVSTLTIGWPPDEALTAPRLPSVS